MKEDLVLIEDFSIIFNKVIYYMNVNEVHLTLLLLLLLLLKYLHGNQQVFLVVI